VSGSLPVGQPSAALDAWYHRLAAAVAEELPGAVVLRHRLHADPRLSGDESDTAATVAGALGGAGRPVAGTGRVIRVRDGRAGTVAVRAELDGVAVVERTGVPWAATGEVMHACGHDVHLAGLVALGRAVARVGGPAPLLAVLQPREETAPDSGARDIVASGVLEEEGVTAVVGAHVQPELPAGVVAVTPGAVNAAIDGFTVTVQGRGGHSGYPQTTADPVLALASVVVALQSVVSRRTDPVVGAVLAVTQLDAGSAFNVVPHRATAHGALRTMREEDRVELARLAREVAEHTAAAHGCSATFEVHPGEPVLRNDPALARAAVPWLGRWGAPVDDAFRSFGADDFAYYCTAHRGLMAFVGVDAGPPDAAGERPGLHSAGFLPGDDVVRQVALTLLAGYLGAAGLAGPVPAPGRTEPPVLSRARSVDAGGASAGEAGE
jgi:amidohydrolase